LALCLKISNDFSEDDWGAVNFETADDRQFSLFKLRSGATNGWHRQKPGHAGQKALAGSQVAVDVPINQGS
jgi:hypothetical protein